MEKYDYDVVVVGSGMSGGIAAKEFCEKGYKVLVLDRGKEVNHRNYPTEFKAPWEMPFRGRVSETDLAENYPVQRNCLVMNEFTRKYFVNDKLHPYIQQKPFDWFRSDNVGGKSLIWGRQCYRWNKLDFEANKHDGHGVEWPIGYEDIEPWYDYIEPFVGISGSYESLDHLPDGQFLKPHPLNIVEREVKDIVEKRFPGRKIIPSRVANLTETKPIHTAIGRGQCQARNECERGCSWGGYYSSLCGGLEVARRTGNMTLIANAQVQKVQYDETNKKATGVTYVNMKTLEEININAKLVFLCASTLATVQILLNSKSDYFPEGIGNTSGTLGHYIMDHIGGANASGDIDGHLDSYYRGRRPSGIYIPRFRNLDSNEKNTFIRGYGFQGSAFRGKWHRALNQDGIGAEFKNSIRNPGKWRISITGFGEMLPRYENRVYLHHVKKDKWGLPVLITDVSHSQNEVRMHEDMLKSGFEMLNAAGVKNVKVRNDTYPPGHIIHEMGGACMGKDATNSYLNKWSQSHEVRNLFVTDGAGFSSISCVNPSITFMALTARAADYADKQIKAGKI